MKTINTHGYNLLFIVLFIGCIWVLISTADTMSIGYRESLIYFNGSGLLYMLTNFSTSIFGQNDIALRLPFILFYALSTILLYKITDNHFKKPFDRFISIAIFMILPGVLSAALMVNESIIVIFCVLLYLYVYEKTKKHNYILLFLFVFIDNAFAIFFLALFFYSLQKKDNNLLVLSLMFFGLSMYLFGFDTGGKPKGYLLNAIGIYASIFSPFIFLYFFYSQYRISIKGIHNIYWYITITALAFSLLLSFRQKILIEDFAPFVVISIPFMVQLFLHSFRVRLPRFQKKHFNIACFSLITLVITTMCILFHKPLYLILENPKKHFAYNYNHAKEIAQILHKNQINNVYSSNERLLKRLEFYGISQGFDHLITTNTIDSYSYHFPITYNQHKIVDLFVTKVNKK